MALKYISFLLFVWISVPYNIKVSAKRPATTKPIFSEIVRNISRVNNLLQDLIKNYIQLEQLSKPKNEEIDYKTDTEVEELFDGETNKRAEDRYITKSDKFIGTPLYFSDLSLEKESKTKETEEKGHKDENDEKSDDISTNSVDTSLSDLSSKSDNSSDEILTGRPRGNKAPGEAKILVIHLASSKKPGRKTSKRKILSKQKNTVKKKIRKTKPSYLKSQPFSDVEQVKKRLVFRADSDDEDVCTKAVMKKCSRALSAVLKDTCSKTRKCAQKFKDDFKKNSVTGCTNKFKGQSACRIGDHPERTGERLTDLKKQYLRMTCLRTLTEMKEPTDSADHLKAIDEDPKFRQINILRERYEKACQKRSYTKCRDACTFAIIKTCKLHDCVSDKEKFMDRSCRRRCRESYSFTGTDTDDSDSDSDSSDSD